MKHKVRKAMSLLIALTMILSLLPVSVMAIEEEPVTLTGITAPEQTSYEAVTGTEQDGLGLPETLEATRQVVTEEPVLDEDGNPVLDEDGAARIGTVVTDETVTVNVAWAGEYAAETAGTYTLTASAEGYVLADGVQWPTVTVTLTAAEEPAAVNEPGDEVVTEATVGTADEFAAAFADSNIQTITLSGDIVLSSGCKIQRALVIDLNTHTLTVGTSFGLTISNAVTVQNGTVSGYVNVTGNTAQATITDCTLDGTDSNNPAFIINSAAGTATAALSNCTVNKTGGTAVQINGGTVTITGGSVTGGSASGAALVVAGGSVTLSGDVTNDAGTAVQVTTGKAEITGGSITGADGSEAVANLGGTASITGGTFSSDVSTYVAAGYKYENGKVIADTAAPSNVAKVGGTEYVTLAAAVAAVPTDGTAATITLLDDIVMETGDIVTIPSGANVKLDMAGHSITTTSDFVGRPITNHGTLTVTGNGTIDSSMAEKGGYGAINNFGTLTIENGTFSGAPYSDGSVVYNRANATLIISGGSFTKATRMISNAGTATINGGTFISTSCNQDKDINTGVQLFAYAIVNGDAAADLTISSGTFTGVQGAVAVNSGTAKITGGTFKTVACVKEGHSHSDGGTWHALYVAGEEGVASCEVIDGSFETTGSHGTVRIGNDNTSGDGGVNAQATCLIKGGRFTAPEGQPALVGAENTGNPLVSGGIFSSAVDAQYCADGFKPKANDDGTYGVTKSGVAQIGEAQFETLQAAIDSVTGTAATVTLLQSVEESVTIAAGQTITLDLNGKSLSGVADGKAILTNEGTLTIADHAGGGVIGASAGSTSYTIENHGTMTIGEAEGENDFTIQSDASNVTAGNGPSLVRNGKDPGDVKAALVIYGGTFSGGLNNVKNEPGSDLTVHGGSFTYTSKSSGVTGNILNYSTATIHGGTFNAQYSAARFAARNVASMSGATLNVYDGTFTANRDNILNNGGSADVNVYGGTYNRSVNANCLPEGHFCMKDSATGKYVIETGVVALKDDDGTVGGYDSFALAIAAARELKAADSAGDITEITLTLLKDTAEDVEIPADIDAEFVINLNGYQLTNVNGHTIHNKGTLQIEGVAGSACITAKDSQQALYNEGTLQFSSGTGQTTAISRAEGTNGYVIFNAQGASMNVNAPVSITSPSSTSSCVCNWGELTLGYGGYAPTIDGSYIAVKNDETGVLTVNSGTITGYDQAIQNWNVATIQGGTMNGAVATWAYSDQNGDYAGNTTITAGTINGSDNGSVMACWYEGQYEAKAVPVVTISGDAVVNGAMCKKSTTDGSSQTTKTEAASNAKGTIAVSGGTFDTPVDPAFCAGGYVPAEADEEGKYTVTVDSNVASVTAADGTVTKYESISAAIEAANKLDSATVTLLRDVELAAEDVPAYNGSTSATAFVITASMTIDLGGHTITAADNSYGFGLFTLTTAGVNLTVQNGAVTGKRILFYATAGSLRLDGVAVTSNHTSSVIQALGASAVTVGAGTSVTATGTTPIIASGTAQLDVYGTVRMERANTSTSNFVYGIHATNNSTVKVYDGAEITVTREDGKNSAAIYVPYGGSSYNGKAIVTGGKISGCGNITADIDGKNVEVSGGLFAHAVPQAQCAEGYAPAEADEDGLFTVAVDNSVASVTDAGGTVKKYESLEAAIAAAEAGASVKLLKDVALTADNTPVKIVDKGTADAPITLDLNGHTISGSNAQTGTTDSSTTPGSILWLSGSYVTLTDTSDGEKGGIINESATNKTGSTLFVRSSANNGGHVVIDGGVRIESKSEELTAKNIYFLKNANKDAELLLDINDAEVISGGFTLFVTVSNTYAGTGKVTINGGAFTSYGKVNDDNAMSAVSTTTTINGGTFHSWHTGNTSLVAADKNICIAEEDGAYTVTVTAEPPADYVAKVVEDNQYVLSGDLYGVHILQTPKDKTIEVVKSASYTFPQEKYFGYNLGEPYALTLDLAENVTLSGGMTLQLADVAVTGTGSLEDGFAWTPYSEDYEMTANGEDGVYSCRLRSSAVDAYIVKADGTKIAYPLVYNALSAAKGHAAGCTVILNRDAQLVSASGNPTGASLYPFNAGIADVTLDLNGHTLSYAGTNAAITLSGGAKLTVTDTSETGGGVLEVSDKAVAAIGADGSCEIVIDKPATVKGTVLLDAANSSLTVSGTVDTTAFASAAAIANNGSAGKGPTAITILDGAVIKANTTDGHGIYHPQTGTLTISGNVEISGRTGVEVRSGTLTVSGSENGVPKISGAGTFAVAANGSGTTTDGVGIAVAQHTTKNEIHVTVLDGEISGVYGLYESNPQGNGPEDIAKVTIDISGGKFVGREAAVESADCTGFISGGTFSSKVEEADCAPGYVPTEADADNMYTVEAGGEAVIVETRTYGALSQMLNQATAGQTVKLLKPVEETALFAWVRTDITLDLNGHNLTVEGLYSKAGYVIDSAGGGILAAEDYTMHKVNQGYLPVYNTEKNGYQLFTVGAQSTQNGTQIIFAITGAEAEALALMQAAGHGNVKAVVDITWTDSADADGYKRFTYNAGFLDTYFSEYPNKAFYLTVTGLTADMGTVTVTPKLISSTGTGDTNVMPEIVCGTYALSAS